MALAKILGVFLLAVLVSAGRLGDFGSSSYGAPPSGFVPSGVSSSYGPPSSGGFGGVGGAFGGGHGSEQPKAYQFGYAVRDFATGNDYQRHETSDGNVVQGEYRVQLPDGRTQVVTYTADWQNGYRARVTYEGQAIYPPAGPTGIGGGNDFNQGSNSFSQFGGVSSTYGPPGYHK